MGRDDSWLVERLDRRGYLLGRLPRVRGGSLSWSIFKAVPGSGSIELTRTPGTGIDWLNDRIRITHLDGDKRTAMGVWLISMPGWDTDGPVTHTTIGLLDKTEALNSPIGQWLTYPAGAVVTDQAVAIIRARGEMAISVAASPSTLRTAMTWEPQDTWLTVVNDLLATINYGSLWADMDGRLRVEPYVAPADRPIAATYGAAPDGLPMRPQWGDEADVYSLPTGVRIYVPGDETTPGLIGRADLPDSHPLSAASRGRELLLVEQGEAVDQVTANALAARRLDGALQVTRRVTVTHPVDATQVNDVVTHGPLALNAAIVERSVALAPGAAAKDTIRHIYTGGDLPWPSIS